MAIREISLWASGLVERLWWADKLLIGTSWDLQQDIDVQNTRFLHGEKVVYQNRT